MYKKALPEVKHTVAFLLLFVYLLLNSLLALYCNSVCVCDDINSQSGAFWYLL